MKAAPMARALALAREAFDAGEVPVGAVVIASDGRIVGEARNAMRGTLDPTAHAEILAIRAAAKKLGSERLTGCDLYVSLEPCAMCAGAISFARIRRLYFGAEDIKQGAVENGPRFFSSPTCHHAPEVYGHLGETEAADLMKRFFASRRG
ncbi:tRNA-specific adenosine-34 deaminase [hydrothermal vent metagenome]|uniref:tRNA-specific adenosine deaminase 2 n=1 Tax=hydrothermal vent metagenome TaxID=652676 RepID=A0A3B0U7G6_9ZZZZ